jgi:hypothetical protein
MLMPPMAKTRARLDGALGTHLLLIAGLAVATLVLALRPGWIVDAGYRCQMQILLGLRCPFCGMTRDFAAILHGGKAGLNPCSWLAAVVVYVVYPASVAFAWWAGRLDVFSSKAMKSGVVLGLAVMLVLNNLH